MIDVASSSALPYGRFVRFDDKTQHPSVVEFIDNFYRSCQLTVAQRVLQYESLRYRISQMDFNNSSTSCVNMSETTLRALTTLRRYIEMGEWVDAVLHEGFRSCASVRAS